MSAAMADAQQQEIAAAAGAAAGAAPAAGAADSAIVPHAHPLAYNPWGYRPARQQVCSWQ